MCEERLELRSVEEADAEDLYNWRNHPLVRQGSFHTDPITWEEHRRWFKEKRQSPKATIYVAYLREGKVGTIRFDEEEEVLKVSVMLNPDYVGQGFGPRCITQGVEKILRHMDKPIVAEIKSDNLVSVKAFEKAGFVRDKGSLEGHLVYVFDRKVEAL